ncbi:alpha/beta hydrolase [Novosphingobium cyanobacteriorum]|uniref:Alpha/beta fold hydrolase n=1 Tax=Novosphingobium cyanobacteriorum TaxID=3024215 RepID=A0ABT6CHJ7_9SPHN|nr:alpha/beta fold hydrolase [Novosphingobium cyanobacteriorum]MDF8332763.1 alpha/beta fold hydrolase [Novosphingobium cyanobacteriorum]
MRPFRAVSCLAALAITLAASPPSTAQVNTSAPAAVAGAAKVKIESITVHGRALEGALEGDSADREVLVVLPPSYGKAPHRRYPVVYALHGYSIGARQWTGEIHVPQVIEGAFAQGAHEMIFVFPDSKTAHNGSMYSASVTTGDYERFISHDLVAYIDNHYRTLATRASRGLVGHSMGGYGATRIGMKHADVFGALYLMSPCCLSARGLFGLSPEAMQAYAAMKSPADSASLPWAQRGTLAAAAAWSPNPANPPLYLDLPLGPDGKPRDDVLAKWAANAPLSFVDQYIGNLRRYAAIAMDVGDKDSLKDDTARLHEALLRYGIANSFTIYDGDHTSRVAFRFQAQVVPFFSQHLASGAAK